MRKEHLGLSMKYPRSCALLHHERLNDTTGCLEDKHTNENNRPSFSHCSVQSSRNTLCDTETQKLYMRNERHFYELQDLMGVLQVGLLL